MKKRVLQIIIFFICILIVTTTYASNINLSSKSKEELEEYVQKNSTNLNIDRIIEMYTDLSNNYSNREIANIIEENKEQVLKEAKIDEETLIAGTSFLRTMDTEETKRIIKEDLNIEEIKEKLNNGYSPKQIINEMQKEMNTGTKIKLIYKILFANLIIKYLLIISGILFIYKIIIKWKIFKKANKHGFASIIPIYNEITYLKVCKINPFWILVLLIPIFGWIIYAIVKILSRFMLADAFKKGILFGFGVLLFRIIFESIIAFSKNIKYEEVEE